ncbi:MAG TPA: hypothetical protein VJU18_02200 [Vicinamibacteria bacterium]|nr:hypothetical protein [Vicinamibacteria bacterium]
MSLGDPLLAPYPTLLRRGNSLAQGGFNTDGFLPAINGQAFR